VIVEVNLRGSRQPAQEAPSLRPGPSAEPTERFSLAPLPTSAVPPEEQLLGVSERLLASPIPEIELEESPALQVLGPLAAPPDSRNDGARRKPEAKEAPATIGGAVADISVASPPSETGKDLGDLEDPGANNAPGTTRDTAPAGEKLSLRSAPRRPWDGEVSNGRAQFFIFIGGDTSWQEFEPRSRCDAGRYTVRVRIGGGLVREVWPVGGATSDSPSRLLCASELVRGLTVPAVVDGDYAAEVVVEPRGARTD